ncbi:MAG TPA: hypothetical protein VKU36_03855 [Candidatus Babeliales bacterium]|nr:hypothetical protein [Candidatus Babeliales bacterium]
MKKLFLYAFTAFLFFAANDIHSFGKKTLFGIRSQGLDGALELAGWQQLIYQYDQDVNYGTFAAAAKYTRSIKPDKIAEFLFGTQKLRFSGSRADRQQGDILADYFGLPADFSSTVCFSPHITNFIMDFDWFQSFDAGIPGLYIMLHMPVVHTTWNLYMNENNIVPGTAFYPAGYMSATNIPASDLPHTVTRALQGKTIWGDMDQSLKYGKIFGRQSRVRVAELQGTLGWNYNQPWYHVGVCFRVGAPTGNATNAEFLFEEIIGNRHHWDVGFGMSAHVYAWEDKDKGRRIAFYLDAHISHLCASEQKRSFDFTANGNGSRYILMEQLDSSAQNLLINGAVPANQYMGNLVNAINYTTFDTHISIGVQADVVLKCAYQREGFEFDLGYDFWANSKEKLHCRDTFPANKFALKGDAQIYGFTPTPETAIALNATQSQATLLGGQGNGNSNFQNLNADNQPALATTGAGVPLTQLNSADAAALSIAQLQVHGSNPAILLKDSDINNESGILPRALSHKIFAYAGCLWDNRDDIDPYLGMGLSGEFANTNPCNNAMCSQWAIWVKGGISY